MNLYAESSAVLAWLMGETRGEPARAILARASLVLTSLLTLIECDRVLIAAQATGRISEVNAADRKALLRSAASHWHLLQLNEEIMERVGRPFPSEPLRTLDAVHVASALFARSAIGPIGVLSLDERIRKCCRKLGLPIVPQ